MKPCPGCGGRNAERSQFCHTCGARLPATEELSPLDQTGAAEPNSGDLGEALPRAGVAVPTPSAPPVPTPASTCAACGYRLTQGQVASWCPGCGRLFEGPVAGAAGADAGAAPLAEAGATRKVTPAGARTTDVVASAHPGEPPPSAAPPSGWALVLLKAGERLDRFPLRTASVILGRTEGDYSFPEDLLLSPRHARLQARGRAFWLEDAGSRNGTFLRLTSAEELRHEDVITFGSLVFRYESSGPGVHTTSLITSEGGVKLFGSGRERARGRIVRILQDGSDGPAYPLTPAKTIVGRKLGHFLFPDDPLLSRQHVQFFERDGEMFVEDLGSSNGTMLRLREPAELSKGMVFRIGDVTLEVAAP